MVGRALLAATALLDRMAPGLNRTGPESEDWAPRPVETEEGEELLEAGVVRAGSLGGPALLMGSVLLPAAAARGVVVVKEPFPLSVRERLDPPLLPPDLDVLAERGRENVVSLGTGTAAS